MPAVPNIKIKCSLNDLHREGKICKIDFKVYKSYSYFVTDPLIQNKLINIRITQKILNIGMGDLRECLMLENKV